MRSPPLTFRFAAYLVAAAGLALGCQPNDRPAPDGGTPDQPGSGRPAQPARSGAVASQAGRPPVQPAPAQGGRPPAPPAPGRPGPTDPSKEDPEVASYLKNKGWKLYRDFRLADGKHLTYLTVEAKGNPFEKVAVTDDDYRVLARSKTVQVLDLRNVNCTDAGLKAVAASAQLEGIIVHGEDVTDAGVKTLAGCKTLDSITLFSMKKVTDAGVKELAALPRLQALYFGFLTLDGSAFEAFANASTLTALTLDYVDGFTDDGARHVARLPALTELKIRKGFGESRLTAAGIKAIVDARLPAKFDFDRKLIDDALFASLVAKGWLYGPTPAGARDKRPATPLEVQSIVLDDSAVTDKGFEAVLDCINIRSLHAQRTGITDATLKKLAGFKKLDYLALEKTKVTAAGLDAIAGLPIRHVAMQGCELSEDTFKAFGKMSALEELWLSDAKMKAEWLRHVSALPKLKELKLMNADFNDAAVKHLTPMPSLRDVTLNNTKLGDAGFLELLKKPELQRIYVDGTGVTKEVYQKAKKDYPRRSFYFYRYDS